MFVWPAGIPTCCRQRPTPETVGRVPTVRDCSGHEWIWNESCFRPPLCTYSLNWARRTSWGWWDDWDDTVLQTQDSKFEPWRSEAEHATSWSRRLPTILTFTRGWGRNIFVSFKPPRPGTEPRMEYPVNTKKCYTTLYKCYTMFCVYCVGRPLFAAQGHETLTHYFFNVGPVSATLAQH